MNKVSVILCLLIVWTEGRSQDHHFSQFYANPLYLSPSLAGATDGGRLIVNYRNQWPAVSKAFSTYAVSFDNFFPSFNSGIGFYLIRDRAGTAGLTTSNAAFQYSYNLIVSEQWQVVPAVQFAYGNKKIDFSKAVFPDQMPSSGGGSGAYGRLSNEQVHYVDLAASVFLYSPKYWVGLTLDHLAEPNYTFLNEEAEAERKYVVFGGMNIWRERRRGAHPDRAFSAGFRYRHQGRFDQFDLGVYWHNSPLEIGVWYRGLPVVGKAENSTALNQDAVVALLAYDLGSVRVAYSYDITVSSLGWSTAGAHELSLIFEFNRLKGLRSGGRRPAVPCSESANPLSSEGGKYTRKKRRLYQ